MQSLTSNKLSIKKIQTAWQIWLCPSSSFQKKAVIRILSVQKHPFMCPLPHTAHYRSDVTKATLTTKEASTLKPIRTIHNSPPIKLLTPLQHYFSPQVGPWSRPQQIPPYPHPQLPSKRLSLILSPLIYQIQSPSPHSAYMHVRSYGTDST